MIETDYFNLVKSVLCSDILQQNRTGIKTKYIPAGILTCDLREGFPMMTASKRGYKYVSQIKENSKKEIAIFGMSGVHLN